MSWETDRTTVAAFLALAEAAGSQVNQENLKTITGWYNTAVKAHERKDRPDLQAIAERTMLELAASIAGNWKELGTPSGAAELARAAIKQAKEAADQLPKLPDLSWVLWLLGGAVVLGVGGFVAYKFVWKKK